MRAIHSIIGLFVAAAFAAPAVAQDSSDDYLKSRLRSVVQGKASDRDARKVMKRLAEEVIGAAHPSGGNRGLDSFTIQRSGRNSIIVSMSLTYYGALTQRQYSADASIVIDMSDPDEPEVDRIEVSKGNNYIPPNQRNLAELKSRLNKLLEK
jgi:hypothetical protein